MRTVQEIFDAVIDAGFYMTAKGSDYMCHAIDAATFDNLINYEEGQAAKGAIADYLRPSKCETMSTHLNRMHNAFFWQCPVNVYGSRDFTAVYRDWANRPANPGVYPHATFN